MNRSSDPLVVLAMCLVVLLGASEVLAAEVTLNSDETCYPSVGETVTVTIDMTNASVIIVGGQFFLEYDDSLLAFVSAEPGDAPFVNEIAEFVPGDDGAGTIDYSVGVANGGVGTMADSTMVVLTFETLAATCEIPAAVSFRAHGPPNRISDEFGGDETASFIDLFGISVDSTPPSSTCPSDTVITLGGSTDPADTGMASGNDDCDPAPTAEFVDSEEAAPCPLRGIITRTWTVTDSCGNTDQCDQIIEVLDYDSDGDGFVNCADACPTDSNKTEPGFCGCGTPDVDTDGDTVLDCDDRCPGKDDLADENGNGIPDCLEGPTIPTASSWGLLVMALILCVFARIRFRDPLCD